PNGTCGHYLDFMAYESGFAEYFTLYEKVDGFYWQPVQTIPNDAPPVWISVTVTESTRYGLTYTTYNGCESTPMKEFTLSPEVPMPSVTGDTDLCSGDNTTITASGAGASYRWYNGTTLI